MRGSMPNCAAVPRRRDRDVGELLGGRVGDDRAVAVDQHPVREAHEEHARHGGDAGRVLMISNDGLMVCAVVCAAPETMPSASPICTIMVPKYETSRMISRARSTVIPLCARSSVYSRRTARTVRWSAGRGPRPRQVETELRRARADLRTRRRGCVRSATPRCSSAARGPQDPVVVALGQHDVLAVRPGPVQQRVLEHLRRDHRGMATASCASRSAASTCCSNNASAVSTLRCESAVSRPRVAATALAVPNVPSSVAMIGRRARALDQPGDRR